MTKTYSLFLACERGCSPYVARELLLKKISGTVQEHDTCVIVEGVSAHDLVKAAYLLQTPMRMGWQLGEFAVDISLEETLLELEVLFGNIDLKPLFVKDASFMVKCHREGTHEFTSVDISMEAGQILKRLVKETCGFVPPVDIKKPDMELHLHIDEEQGWFSLDILGHDPAKRPYKVFNNPHSVKGPVAACLLMASGWKPGDVLVDPFTSGGVIPIEAALFASGTSLQFYEKKVACVKHPEFAAEAPLLKHIDDSRVELDAAQIFAFDARMPNVVAAKKNAKIAGVEKYISYSRMEVEWLDTKVEEKSVSRIICHPVEHSKHIPADKARSLQKELFHQADFCLRKDGTLTFISHHPEDLIAVGDEYGYKLKEQRLIHMGQLGIWVLVFIKK